MSLQTATLVHLYNLFNESVQRKMLTDKKIIKAEILLLHEERLVCGKHFVSLKD